MTKFLGIIPARYASTRFPGKPLADIGGKTMIQRVYEQASKSLNDLVVATDDQRIFDTVHHFGGNAIMTSTNHKTGTDRCFEALTKTEKSFDVVINIQGDEPFIDPCQIEAIKKCFDDPRTEIATLIKPYKKNDTLADLKNPNSPKVIFNANHEAIYFSRSVIPYLRNVDENEWTKQHQYYKHIGLYAYKSEILQKIVAMPQSELEKAESLEQLRWIENRLCIKVAITDAESISIDTPEDLQKAIQLLNQ
ncbi:MAG: 3-deoxy-manno-octulosonate cytidylyltransferase [Paludibacteraceae bacterium]|jgi:3-deoxy-manno-octulosonate cytidylyltransferase (CMP-KDO synthetase)|nr:3-deoxy-manno-octulosonate cytidylyltransferase [Paludibacteraceae bacterium]